ncbi:MAG: hypothetical protein JXB05_32725 [Myxococcaceae bacterium]|nr:hypothetical protein [Myxococcaceae bacterium]
MLALLRPSLSDNDGVDKGVMQQDAVGLLVVLAGAELLVRQVRSLRTSAE